MRKKIFLEKNRLERNEKIKIVLPENEVFDPQKYFLERMYPKGHGYGFPDPRYSRNDYYSFSALYNLSPISNIPEMHFNIFELKFDPSMNLCLMGLEMEEIISNLDIGFLTEEEMWYVIAELTKIQLNGEEGNLVVNSRQNIIGRVLCKDNIIRFVGVHWIPAYNEWRISSSTEKNAGVERNGQVLQLIKKISKPHKENARV